MHIVAERAVKLGLLTWMSFAVCGAILTAAQATFAQDLIRVETNQVLVPVHVLDKDRAKESSWHQSILRALSAGDARLADSLFEGVEIRNLTAADFQVFEDGREQSIQKVTYERSLYWDVRDNVGHHTEYMGPGGGNGAHQNGRRV